jgi:phosphoketolase
MGELVTVTAGASTAPDLDDTDLTGLDAWWRATAWLEGRFHLAADVIDRVPGLRMRHAALRQHLLDERRRCRAHTRAAGEDAPDVRDWCWPA